MSVRHALLFLAACWLLGACVERPIPPAIRPSATQPMVGPTQPATPTGAAIPRILSFTVSPNPVERGQDLIVSWQVDGAMQATLWQLTYDSKLNKWYRQSDPVSSGSNSGEYRLTVPGDMNRTLRFELEARNIEHGLLVPLQFCGDRQLVIDLLSATSEAGATMTTPPRFYLYRSWVWPAPDSIQANPAMPWTMNVAVPRIDSAGWQLTTDVPAGMYLLIFERDRYDSSTDPQGIPASVTYRISEETP